MGFSAAGFSAAGARQKLVELHSAWEAKKRAEADQFRLFAEFADEYRYVPDEGPVLTGTERLMHWGGDGTPGVAEFCTLEVAAALRMSEEKVRIDIGMALAVRHRLPHLWDRVMALGIRVWQAGELAAATHNLSYFQALDLDEEIDGLVESMAFTRLLLLVKARVLDILRDASHQEHDAQLARRKVEIHPSNMGVSELFAVIDVADGVFLNAQLNRIAEIFRQAGSTDSLEVRRAQALGALAFPARALQLIQASLLDELPDLEIDRDCPNAGQRGHACGTITVDPDRLLPKVDLVVHINSTGLQVGDGLVRVENIGPMLAGWTKDMLGHTRVRVRPVLNPNNLVPTDAYECSAWMREHVQLRNPYEVFPYSKKTSKALDLDHTIPWDTARAWESTRELWEKPTRSSNLGPISRKVHRAKTHGGWELTQPSPGTFLWRSPLGFGYLVTPSHSWMIEDPSGQILPKQVHPAAQTIAS